jgi:hypothetical protein
MPPVKMTRGKRVALFGLQFYLLFLFVLLVLRFTFFR